MMVPHDPASEESSYGGALQWRERGDGHWIAQGLGGQFELVPERIGDAHGWHVWWMGRGETPVDLGRYPTYGGATMAAKRYADVPVRHAAEDCDHTHPPNVPSGPCPDPSAHKPVVAVATKVTAVEAEKVLVAGEAGELRWRKRTYVRRTGRHKGLAVTMWIAPVAQHGEYHDAYVVWHHAGESYTLMFEKTAPSQDEAILLGHFDTFGKAKAAAQRDWKKRREGPKAKAPRRRKK